MPVQTSESKVTLQHPKGATAEVLLYGATVISWKSPDERLFLSSKAILDGSKAVRGGIPVVFPCFGPPSHPDHTRLSQHGFARSTLWSWGGVTEDNEKVVVVKLALEPTEAIRAVYDKPFKLTYVVSLFESDLKTELHVENTSGSSLQAPEPFEFQALFHTYIRAPSKDALVSPLTSLSYFDKTEATEEGRATAKTETRSGVDVTKFTDSVYENAPGSYDVKWPGGALHISAKGLKDVVVWNPQAEGGSTMGDMEAGGWDHFVCVEPGTVRGFAKVAPGETWVGEQTLSAGSKAAL
ncbi:galactose mutarotase-like protein [Cylindrobasidium torrendii FP15055 ss-10]|uniref:Glucose-6-phosphate 1-epimerase n=1 Tax=Cylindrobasidium torrendii FP15055 ss-10 TaxID=1314674 RepID=A0A0D7BMC9_9AGAR|nr:galactose mutarotase-like protein [Cylindrobasidium torrendii FP15055 ss-10]